MVLLVVELVLLLLELYDLGTVDSKNALLDLVFDGLGSGQFINVYLLLFSYLLDPAANIIVVHVIESVLAEHVFHLVDEVFFVEAYCPLVDKILLTVSTGVETFQDQTLVKVSQGFDFLLAKELFMLPVTKLK